MSASQTINISGEESINAAPAAQQAPFDPFTFTEEEKKEFTRSNHDESYARFIKAHFEPNDNVCFTLLDPEKKRPARNIFMPRADALDPNFVANLHEFNKVYNVYVGMNAYNPALVGEINNGGRTEGNVVGIRNLYADADVNGRETLHLITTSVDVPGEVTDILESSPGKFQFIWRVQDMPKEAAKEALRAIIQKFGTDEAVKDVARVLRVPGFKNLKYPAAPVVRVVRSHDKQFTRADFKLKIVQEDKLRVNASVDGPPIPYGLHDRKLFEIGCALRNAGLGYEEIREHLIRVCEKRCQNYGSDFIDMCTKKAASACKYEVGQAAPGVVMGGRVLGQTPAETVPTNWRSHFRNLSEMEQGDIVMIIDGVLQEGTCFLGANPGNGKTLVALAFAKAICLGQPLFGIADYTVQKPRNVIYLIPESADRAFRRRGEAFRLPPDDRFIARTISSGGPLALSDPALMEAVRQTKPVIILDTASRFLQADDENSAAQNRMLVNDITALRAAGAPCVIILHRAKKSQSAKRETMTLDNMLRGTSDFGAMCDQAYGIRMDEHLYNRGAGPMEIELVNLKDRERLGGLTSIRLAASYKRLGAIFPTSYIDETGNFRPVDYKESKARDESTLNSLVEANPMMTVAELSEATGIKPYSVKESLKRFGWHCMKGGPDGRSPWHKDGEYGCPYQKGGKKPHAICLDSVPESVPIN